jgi:hypothetical protein
MLDNRNYDKKIDLIVQQIGKLQEDITQVKQRQVEFTIPRLEKLAECFDNLLREHILCKSKIDTAASLGGKVSGIIFTLILYAFVFVGSYAVVKFQVAELWAVIKK